MKKHNLLSSIALTVVLGIALMVCVIIRALVPMAILPKLDIPNMVLLSLVSLLIGHYLTSGQMRWSVLTLPAAALTFGLLPWAAGFAQPVHALKLAAVGGVVFCLTAWLFASMLDRLSTGPSAKAAPIFSALGLYLASQCLMGIIL